MADAIVVAVIDVEGEAYQASDEIKASSFDEKSLINEVVLIEKHDGQIESIDSFNSGVTTLDDTVRGGIVGGLFGILAGPVGMLLCGGIGALVGKTLDSADAVREKSLFETTAAKIYEGETALVILAQEEESVIDEMLGKYETTVMRRDTAAAQAEVEELEALQKDMEKTSRAPARAEASGENQVELEALQGTLGSKKGSMRQPVQLHGLSTALNGSLALAFVHFCG